MIPMPLISIPLASLPKNKECSGAWHSPIKSSVNKHIAGITPESKIIGKYLTYVILFIKSLAVEIVFNSVNTFGDTVSCSLSYVLLSYSQLTWVVLSFKSVSFRRSSFLLFDLVHWLLLEGNTVFELMCWMNLSSLYYKVKYWHYSRRYM